MARLMGYWLVLAIVCITVAELAFPGASGTW